MDINSLTFKSNPTEDDFIPGLVVGINVLPINSKLFFPRYLVVLVDKKIYLDPKNDVTAEKIIRELREHPQSREEFPVKYGIQLIRHSDIEPNEQQIWRDAFGKFIQAGKETTSLNVEWSTNYPQKERQLG